MPLHILIRVAGQHWRIEESFQAAKGLAGLDEHQVRRWTSWHRWTTLAMLAHAFLAVATAAERDHAPTPAELIAPTINEFRRLFDALLIASRHTISTLLAWSTWRRRHQARARQCHYRRREPPTADPRSARRGDPQVGSLVGGGDARTRWAPRSSRSRRETWLRVTARRVGPAQGPGRRIAALTGDAPRENSRLP